MAYLRVFLNHSLLLIPLKDVLRGGGDQSGARKIWRGRWRMCHPGL